MLLGSPLFIMRAENFVIRVAEPPLSPFDRCSNEILDLIFRSVST
jgi:hypothetical protein